MAKTRFPKQGRWSGQFPGELTGDIISSFNIDLQRNPGTIHIAEKLQELFNPGRCRTFTNIYSRFNTIC